MSGEDIKSQKLICSVFFAVWISVWASSMVSLIGKRTHCICMERLFDSHFWIQLLTVVFNHPALLLGLAFLVFATMIFFDEYMHPINESPIYVVVGWTLLILQAVTLIVHPISLCLGLVSILVITFGLGKCKESRQYQIENLVLIVAGVFSLLACTVIAFCFGVFVVIISRLIRYKRKEVRK